MAKCWGGGIRCGLYLVGPGGAIGSPCPRAAQPARITIGMILGFPLGDNGAGDRAPHAAIQTRVRAGGLPEFLVLRFLTLPEKAFCRQRRGMWPFDSASACACLRAALLG